MRRGSSLNLWSCQAQLDFPLPESSPDRPFSQPFGPAKRLCATANLHWVKTRDYHHLIGLSRNSAHYGNFVSGITEVVNKTVVTRNLEAAVPYAERANTT